ncbi:hypothetical protein [Mycobacterium lepromatosis]|uniref:hypothetical protein n=1 Tax=Mycobacterium lepromatosis TaxID=480418 RepID=UPI0005F85C8F|nr:hypothetical protein [Mycobacterium lepromatosis]UKN42522.1 hypothetical protein MLPF_2006 [Mycobacterium lepromatosis]
MGTGLLPSSAFHTTFPVHDKDFNVSHDGSTIELDVAVPGCSAVGDGSPTMSPCVRIGYLAGHPSVDVDIVFVDNTSTYWEVGVPNKLAALDLPEPIKYLDP